MRKIFKFAISGAIGFGIIEVFLYVLTRAHQNYFDSLIVGFEVSIPVNFLLNEKWTFGDEKKKGSWIRRLGGFEVTTLFSRIANFGIFLLAANYLNIFIAEFVGVCVGFVGNYLQARYLIWRRPK